MLQLVSLTLRSFEEYRPCLEMASAFDLWDFTRSTKLNTGTVREDVALVSSLLGLRGFSFWNVEMLV